ncbi:MAG TPA: hypothetical protein VLW83_03465 [Candidatus Acidoferrales bacterium]|nr:hypothetical protein [Candidatus Acidoferrales bacterium]
MRIAAWLMCAALLMAAALPAWRGDDRTLEAEAILVKAWDVVDIRAPGSAPFVMKAKVRLAEGEKSTDGVYAMSWSAPDRFRRVIGFRDYAETDVARGENYYSKRNTEGVPLMVWELGELMDSLGTRKKLPVAEKVKRIERESIVGKEATCILSGPGKGDSKICVDAATDEVLSVAYGLDGPAAFQERSEYSDYQDFGTKRFPRHLVFSGWNKHSIEVSIVMIVPVHEFAADEFSPPAGSEVSRRCAGNEEMKGEVTPMFGNAIPVGFENLDVDIYFEITPTGGVRSAQIVYSSDPKADKEILGWFIGAHFPVMSCDGRPMGYAEVYRMIGRR